MLLKCFCILLIATVGFGQDLRVASPSIQNAQVDRQAIFRQNSPDVSQNPPAKSGPVKKTVKGKSHRKLWIALAAILAGSAVTSIEVLNKTRG